MATAFTIDDAQLTIGATGFQRGEVGIRGDGTDGIHYLGDARSLGLGDGVWPVSVTLTREGSRARVTLAFQAANECGAVYLHRGEHVTFALTIRRQG